jgi:hypothetical protein
MSTGGASEHLGSDHVGCFAARLADQTTSRPRSAEAGRGALRTRARQAARQAFSKHAQTLHAGRVQMSPQVEDELEVTTCETAF